MYICIYVIEWFMLMCFFIYVPYPISSSPLGKHLPGCWIYCGVALRAANILQPETIYSKKMHLQYLYRHLCLLSVSPISYSTSRCSLKLWVIITIGNLQSPGDFCSLGRSHPITNPQLTRKAWLAVIRLWVIPCHSIPLPFPSFHISELGSWPISWPIGKSAWWICSHD